MAWAHFLLKAATRFQENKKIKALPNYIKEWQCDPWIWIDHIRNRISKQHDTFSKSQNPIEPLLIKEAIETTPINYILAMKLL